MVDVVIIVIIITVLRGDFCEFLLIILSLFIIIAGRDIVDLCIVVV